jgi:uncharacterized protein YcbK (DUF882 family)
MLHSSLPSDWSGRDTVPGRSFSSRRAFLRTATAGLLAAGLPLRTTRAAAATAAAGVLSFYNTHTLERLTVRYRGEDGQYDREALAALNYHLRCPATGIVAAIDVRVIEFVDLVDQRLGGRHAVHVISGYRSPEYNAWLARHGGGVASNSLHLQGRAIDIRMPGVSLDAVRRAAIRLARGGVGYYASSGFVHLDSGSFRIW